MTDIVSRLDLTQIFCDVDDFDTGWEKWWQQVPQLPSMSGLRPMKSRMERSEVMTIIILTPANTDDRKSVPDMTQGLLGQLFGDRGYISQPLFEELYERGLQLVTKSKKNMKQRLVKLMDKILLRKRSVIESVNDQLKNICQIEHSRHRSCWNFLVNLIAGLIAYTYQSKLPHLDLEHKGLHALPCAIF